MSTRTFASGPLTRRFVRALGIVVGLGVTAASMSSGFIWASQGEVALVYVAGFFSWTGYVFAHYVVVGEFVDDVSADDVDGDEVDGHDVDGHEMSGDDASGDAANVSGHAGGEGEVATSAGPGRSSDGIRAALANLRAILPGEPRRAIGFLAGIAILVAGIAILAWFVRQENHLLGNLGSGMFLGGYVIAHYFDAGVLL